MSRRIQIWRHNPSDNTTWWVVGGAVGFVAVLALLSMRSNAQAANMQPMPTPPPPTPVRPTPRPRPRPARADMVFTPEEVAAIGGAGHDLVRQPELTPAYVQTTRAIRVLQQQLADLGYEIPAVDGRRSAALQRATSEFLADFGFPISTSDATLLLAVDSRYEHVFGQFGRVPAWGNA